MATTLKEVDPIEESYQKGFVAGMQKSAGVLMEMARASFERRDDDWAVQLRELANRLNEEADDIGQPVEEKEQDGEAAPVE